MRILALSDVESKLLYDHYEPGMFDKYDLIIGCGDLHRSYMEFIATMSKVPFIYVKGNHDDSFDFEPPGGCICIEDTVYEYKGVRFLGLGGSNRYRPGGINMFTEKEMAARIRKLRFTLWRKRGFDVLITHAPAHGQGDLDDLPHKGFECFLGLMDKYKPRLMIHGHVHMNYTRGISREIKYGDTTIMNAYEKLEIEV